MDVESPTQQEPTEGSESQSSNTEPTALDPRLIKKVEIAAQDIGKELDQLMSSVANSVQSVSSGNHLSQNSKSSKDLPVHLGLRIFNRIYG